MSQAEATAFTAGFSPCGHASCMDEHGHWDACMYLDLVPVLNDEDEFVSRDDDSTWSE